MVLPNLSTEVFTYMNALLNWGPIAIGVSTMVAAVTVAVIMSLMMRAFMRG